MSTFRLEITTTCSEKPQLIDEDQGCSSCEDEFVALTARLDDESITNNKEQLQQQQQQQAAPLWIDSVDVSLSVVEGSDDKVVGLCIMVPPTLLMLESMTAKRQPRKCRSASPLHGFKLSKLLQQIQPWLANSGCIRVIIALPHDGISRATPADMIVFQTKEHTAESYSIVMSRLNGVSMATNSDLIIKAFPISSVSKKRNKKKKSEGNEDAILSRASLPILAYQVPSCPVCIHRVEPTTMGLPKCRDDAICCHACDGDTGCRNQAFLLPWPEPSFCSACKVIETRYNQRNRVLHHDEDSDVFCYCCALQETLWVCLICGFVGCGRYSCAHAAAHYQETNHPFSLELATLRIWNYAKEVFVHRNDLLECPLVQRHHMWDNIQYHLLRAPIETQQMMGRGFNNNNNNNNNNTPAGKSPPSASMTDKLSPSVPFAAMSDETPKKATMIGEEYEALLQSALEDQAQHYESEITRLRAALTAERVDQGAMTNTELREIDSLNADINRLRGELDHVGRGLLDVQAQEAGHRAASQRLLREQAVAKDLLDKIREEAAKEHDQGKQQVEDLEQQVADLTGNLRMRHQFSQNQELSNAQIFGTTSTKPQKRGKKHRRLFRNK